MHQKSHIPIISDNVDKRTPEFCQFLRAGWKCFQNTVMICRGCRMHLNKFSSRGSNLFQGWGRGKPLPWLHDIALLPSNTPIWQQMEMLPGCFNCSLFNCFKEASPTLCVFSFVYLKKGLLKRDKTPCNFLLKIVSQRKFTPFYKLSSVHSSQDTNGPTKVCLHIHGGAK